MGVPQHFMTDSSFTIGGVEHGLNLAKCFWQYLTLIVLPDLLGNSTVSRSTLVSQIQQLMTNLLSVRFILILFLYDSFKKQISDLIGRIC
jgi:predicted DNA-binding ribbon-helix-helix protein